MIENGPLAALIAENGLLVLALLCLVDGPVATLAGGWLESIGLLPLGGMLMVAVLGEFVGDMPYYLGGFWFCHGCSNGGASGGVPHDD